ncbi:3'(2'),5'-bisphosphate nucleotidase CysQ [Oceanospirillum sediminis]|uniref:3'(2'),5'-bisphosphate nucleotidase CysQ n=1 Tax=Oceanospirillum sediminis TaxID=2760088 RepID=A0A839IWE1_9GAMM|nr:3'(2'),5'-bisphosphate nucleotidase CysQ [Oceanospirillum sediminis]MBB1489278.1 3'(2'),5'-bisphosphate nucleotidase CysQ [Oceanospirillum sediminis]
MLSDPEVHALLPDVVRIAREAGDAIMNIYQQDDLGVSHKSDDSPLTLADIASHHCIEKGLTELSLSLPVLSEESDNISWQERSQWSDYWLIDPLDGTKEFVKRNGEFTVNIALISDGIPVLGVVYAPVPDHMYHACRGKGAWFIAPGEKEKELQLDPDFIPECWRIAGSRSHAKERMESFVHCLPGAQSISMGSSLKLCFVAMNEADLYVRFGPTCEWDTAAAQAIVEQAGGLVLNDQLQPLRYNTKESLLNPEFVVCQKISPVWQDTFLNLVKPFEAT